jgi:hypothetical protein
MPVRISSLLQGISSGLALSLIGPTLASHLGFSPDICLRDMCSLSEHKAAGAPNDRATIVTMPSWKRVQLDDKQSTSRIYQMLEAGSTQAEALNTVTEIVVKLKANEGMSFFPMRDEHTSPYIEREEARKVKPDHPLRDVLRILDLKNDSIEGAIEEKRLLKILTWSEPEVFTERETRLSADPERKHVQTFISLQDKEFIHHAAPLILMMCPNIDNLTYSACPAPYIPNRIIGPHRKHLLPKTLLRNNYGNLPQRHLQKLRHVQLLSEVGLDYYDGDTHEHIDLLRRGQTIPSPARY